MTKLLHQLVDYRSVMEDECDAMMELHNTLKRRLIFSKTELFSLLQKRDNKNFQTIMSVVVAFPSGNYRYWYAVT